MTESLPLVNYDFALNQLGGNETLLKKMLGKFLAEFSESPKEVEGLIEAGDFDSAKMRVHTAKGISGNLGLKALYESSNILDQQLRDKSIQSDALADYSDKITLTCDYLKTILENDSAKDVPLVAPSQSANSSKAELLEKLGRNEFIDDASLLNLVSGLDCDDAKAQEIIRLIEELQYPAAVDLITSA